MIASLEILGINISKVNYGGLINIINNSIKGNNKVKISYANANTANLVCKNPGFRDHLNSFDIIHPDGFGIHLASGILYKENKLLSRFTGSDFYPLLAEECIKNKWRVFFFGHSSAVFEKIKVKYPKMNICGFAQGYNFHPVKIANEINNKKPDILIIGLGQPIQEELILFYKNDIRCKVIIAVGDGIKVFAGEKIRGPVFMQKLGMEWLIRFLANPFKYFNRYIIGNPLFLYRIITVKIRKFKVKF